MDRTMDLNTRRVILAREILNTESKEYILNSIKEGYKEMQEIKAGKKKGIPARELLKELQDEAI